MSKLDAATTLQPKEEFYRLLDVSLHVPTQEQLDKARATVKRNGGNNFAPRASLRLTWEPLSYVLKGGANGNQTTQFIDVTFGLADGDDLEAQDNVCEAIRTNGWFGIPDRKVIRINDRLGYEAQEREWARWRTRTRDVLDLDIDEDGSITGTRGQLYSTSVGHVFRVQEFMDNFPKNVLGKDGKWARDEANPRRVFMRYPVEDVTDTYIAPANPPQRVVQQREEGPTSTLTASAALNNITASLRQAVIDSGMVGMRASDLMSTAKQINFVTSHMEDSENTIVFGTGDVNEAANNGELLEFLRSKGAISVDDSGVIA